MALVLSLCLGLAACGGGGGGSSGSSSTTANDSSGTSANQSLPVMVDSLNRPVAEALFAKGDAAAVGVDGTAADGLPIVNAPVTLTDTTGASVLATTDAQGYYRANVKGLVPPLVAKVQRPNGMFWFSPSIQPLPARSFVTMNINGLTDKIAGDVAEVAGVKGGAARLTAAVLAKNVPALQTAKSKLVTTLKDKIASVGLNPDFFDPVSSRLEAVATDPYDQLLEGVQALKNQTTGLTDITQKYPLRGTVVGLGSVSGLTLRNGTETIAIEPGVPDFAFSKQIASGTGYSVTVGRQPSSALTCSVSNGVGTVEQAAVTDIKVTCGDKKYAVGGTISGLASATGLQLSNGTDVQTIQANQTSFLFNDTALPGATYNISIKSQPLGRLCNISNQTGTMDTKTVSTVLVSCSISYYTIGGVISGLNANGLVLLLNESQAYSVPSGTVNFVLGSASPMGTSYAVTVKSQPSGLACTVDKGTGVIGGENVTNIKVNCTALATSMVSTLAGNGTAGTTDGTGNAARFSGPTSIALDSAGNVYVADSANHVIRKITTAGVVSTLAGSGSAGNAEGTGTAAQFSSPTGIAIDASGNLFVGDVGNSSIRKVTAAGVVTTLATGVVGSGLAVDASGVIYAADSTNHKILKVSATGTVTVLAGSGTAGLTNATGTAAAFNGPTALTLDAGGNLYVADSLNNVVRKVTAAGVVSTAIVGLTAPKGIALDSAGSYYVSQGNVVFKVNTTANVLAGTGNAGFVDGAGTSATFNQPRGIAMGATGSLYVADFGNHAIRKIAP